MTASTDESALLAAIAADLEDDTVRLVYADWLQEHDQEDRAELIRVQCEKAKHPGMNCGDLYCSRRSPEGLCDSCSRFDYLCRRENKLISAHPEWTRWVCSWCAGIGFGGAGQGGHTFGARCVTCGGLGKLLPPNVEWDRGWPGWVTLLTWTDTVELNGWGDDPTPRLRALAQLPPWGVPLRGVRIAGARPNSYAKGWIWDLVTLPKIIYDRLPTIWHPTERAALDDKARVVLEFGRRAQ